MGDALGAISLGSGFHVTNIAAGLLHTCFVSSGGQLECCGSNAAGQLGYGDLFDRCDGDADRPMEGLGPVPYE